MHDTHRPPAPELQQPILPGTAASDYERYLRTDELLALQKTPAQMSHPDELTFQAVHQSSELLMKAAAWEINRACDCLARQDDPQAARLLRRANLLLDYPISLLRILETITPYDYQVIRAGLGHGSGLDSPGFTSLLHSGPRLGEVFFDRLQKAGLAVEELYRRHQEFFGLHEVAEQMLDFDERLEKAGLAVEELYRRHQEFFSLHEVAEQMLDFDERLQLFRFQHLKLAQRIIGGDVVGTMGTPVEILRQRQEHGTLYKPLWEVRNEITAKTTGAPQK